MCTTCVTWKWPCPTERLIKWAKDAEAADTILTDELLYQKGQLQEAEKAVLRQLDICRALRDELAELEEDNRVQALKMFELNQTGHQELEAANTALMREIILKNQIIKEADERCSEQRRANETLLKDLEESRGDNRVLSAKVDDLNKQLYDLSLQNQSLQRRNMMLDISTGVDSEWKKEFKRTAFTLHANPNIRLDITVTSR